VLSWILLVFFDYEPSTRRTLNETDASSTTPVFFVLASGFAVFGSSAIKILRKRAFKTLETRLTSEKKKYASSIFATLLISPFALYAYSNNIQATSTSPSSLFYYPTLLLVIFLVLFSNRYVERAAMRRISIDTIAKAGLVTSFISGYLIERLWYETATTTWITWISFGLSLIGMEQLQLHGYHHLFKSPSSGGLLLPMSSTNTSSSGSNESKSWDKATIEWSQYMVRRILEDKETRSIFAFLVINLLFMFVEMLYGIWTNSLGLISDACHMLFDCTALAIGLVAAIIAKWEPNQSFSYGYFSSAFHIIATSNAI